MRIATVFFLIALILQGCSPVSQTNFSNITNITSPVPGVLDVAPESMRSTMNEAYRLKPDKRFLLAVSQIHSFLSGQKPINASSNFNNGHWEILHGNRVVGTLPELPDFSDFIHVLTLWTVQLQEPYLLNLDSSDLPAQAELEQHLDQFYAVHATTVLKKVNALWHQGIRQASLIPIATRALILLVFQGMDRFETADVLPAKAMAMLALTRAYIPDSLVREECLLASAMGYNGHAVKQADSLPKDDPVLAYVIQDDEQLEKLALADSSTVEIRYLWLARLSRKGDLEGWLEWFNTSFSKTQISSPVLKTGLELSTFYGNRNLPEKFQHVILFELAGEHQPSLAQELSQLANEVLFKTSSHYRFLIQILNLSDTTASTLIKRFEYELYKLEEGNYSGAFLSLSTYKAYIRGNFYSSLYMEGLHYLYALSSVDAAKRFSQEIDPSQTKERPRFKTKFKTIFKQDQSIKLKIMALLKLMGEHARKSFDSLHNLITGRVSEEDFTIPKEHIAHDFMEWYRNLLQSKSARGNARSIIKEMMKLPTFGAQPLFRTLKESKNYFNYADPLLFSAIKKLAHRMDTRFKHQIEMAEMAHGDLLDLRLANKLYRNIFENNPSQEKYLLSWHSYFTGDTNNLKKMLRSPSSDPGFKVKVLQYLGTLKALPPQALKKEYQLLAKDYPKDWYIHQQYAEYLDTIKEYAAIPPLLQGWLNWKVQTGGLERIFAANRIARSYYEQKKYKEGLEIIEPYASSMQAGALWVYGKLLDKTGEIDKAEQVFRAVLKRYPDSVISLAELAGFFWRHARYEEAAKQIRAYPYNLTWNDWRFTLGKKFAETFSNLSTEKGTAAFSALLKTVKDHSSISEFALEVSKTGNYELAFQLHSKIKFGGIGQAKHIVHGYEYVEKIKSPKDAQDWLEKNIHKSVRNPSSMFFFRRKEYKHLWSLIRSPDHYVWMLRAAASLNFDELSKQDRKRLKDHFSSSDIDGHYGIVGKYMLGMVSEEELLKAANNPKKRCEYAYFIGYKAQSENRYEDASDWYRVAVETGMTRNGEYIWAHDTLYIWYQKEMSLARLAKKKL